MRILSSRRLFVALFCLLFAYFFFAPTSTFAQFNLNEAKNAAGEANISQTNDANEILSNMLLWATGILAFIFMAVIVIAGVMFIFSAGAENAKKARQIVFYSIIGLAIALLAWVLLNTASDILGIQKNPSRSGTPSNNEPIPHLTPNPNTKVPVPIQPDPNTKVPVPIQPNPNTKVPVKP